MTALLTFFYARRGRAIGFRFKNHDDFEGVTEEIGEGDGSTVDFQLVRNYESGGKTFVRRITKPVTSTVTIYVDSVLEAAVNINYETGVVTFAVAPTSGEVITADFEFDVPVRFDTDHLPVNLSTYQARSADVAVVEVRV